MGAGEGLRKRNKTGLGILFKTSEKLPRTCMKRKVFGGRKRIKYRQVKIIEASVTLEYPSC